MSEMQQLQNDFVSGNLAPSFLREAPKKRKGKSINKQNNNKREGKLIVDWRKKKNYCTLSMVCPLLLRFA